MTINSDLFADVDKLFEVYDKPDTPGCALAIVYEGEVIYKRGYGLANLEYDIPITPSTVFDIGSVSKQFTAACALLLEYQSKLSLDDDIHEYLPELNYKQPITLRHLIHHTSGIPDYLVLMQFAGMPFYNDYPAAQLIELIAKQPLTFTPGKAHSYSNSGYFLLAEIIARVSGKSLNEFATEYIFKSLGMNSTQFYDDHTRLIKNRAVAYSPTETGFSLEHYKLDIVGDGAVHTTVEDLFLWDQNFYNNKLAGGQVFIDTLLTAGKLTSGKSTLYAFGLAVTTYRGQRLITHAGGWAGYVSEFCQFPEQKFSIIILSNRGDYAFPKAPSIAKLFLKEVLELDDLASSTPATSEPERVAFQMSIEELEHYTGTYENTSLKVQYTITVHNNHLVISLPYNASSLVLETTEKDVFDGLGVRHEFKRDKEKRVRELRLITEQVKPLRFKKVA